MGLGSLTRLYGSSGARARVVLDWVARPQSAVMARVDPRGPVLDVECGLGARACALALACPGRQVHGISTDAVAVAKANRAARQAIARGGQVRFDLSPPGEIPHGPWQSIIALDVLTRLDGSSGRGLLASCAEVLVAGGSLVVANRAQAVAALSVPEALAGEGLQVEVEQTRSRLGPVYELVVGTRPSLRVVG